MIKPALTPELSCSNFNMSFNFYTHALGFNVLYDRPEEGFAMLERQGARIMIEQAEPDNRWYVADLEKPYGRGMNLQIETSDVDSLYAYVSGMNVPIFMPIEDKWYRAGEKYVGNRQFLIQDPDGYLLRFFENLGSREQAP